MSRITFYVAEPKPVDIGIPQMSDKSCLIDLSKKGLERKIVDPSDYVAYHQVRIKYSSTINLIAQMARKNAGSISFNYEILKSYLYDSSHRRLRAINSAEGKKIMNVQNAEQVEQFHLHTNMNAETHVHS